MLKKITTVIITTVLAAAVSLTLVSCARISGIELEPLTISVGSSEKLTPTLKVTDEDVSEAELAKMLEEADIKWTSKNEGVATVDETGVVTGVTAGEAEITAATADGKHTAAIKVTVIVPLESVSAPDSLTIDLLSGGTGTIKLTVTPEKATGVKATYKSADETIATVDGNGVVTGVALGETEITARVTGDGENEPIEKTVSVKVTVRKVPTGIGLKSTSGTLYAGYSYTLTPYSLPEGAEEMSYTFTSGKEKVATVDENGRIRARSAGTAEITVTSSEGLTVVYTVTVTVKSSDTSGGTSGGGTTGGSSGGTTGGQSNNWQDHPTIACPYYGTPNPGHGGVPGQCPQCGAVSSGFGYIEDNGSGTDGLS